MTHILPSTCVVGGPAVAAAINDGESDSKLRVLVCDQTRIISELLREGKMKLYTVMPSCTITALILVYLHSFFLPFV